MPQLFYNEDTARFKSRVLRYRYLTSVRHSSTLDLKCRCRHGTTSAFDICESLKFTFSVAINNMVSEKQHDLPSSFKNDIALKTMQILIEITRNIFRNRKNPDFGVFSSIFYDTKLEVTIFGPVFNQIGTL